ncbi:MAG: sigma-70 family RNA polymerase sigma factor, partial [Comamonas sp.]
RNVDAADEPRAFLTHVAKGLVVDLWRRREIERAYLETLQDMPEPHAPSPETQLQVIEALVHIDRLLAGLAPQTRQVFLLAQLDGCSQAEIAVELGVSDRMVRKYLAQAMLVCALAKAGVQAP